LVKEFNNLGKPDHPYFKQYYHVLETLVEVQCIVLITDLPKAENLIRGIFHKFYEFTEKNNVAGMDFLLTSILSQLVDQAQTLPSDVTELILSQFLNKVPQSKDAKNQSIPLVSRAYNMSKALCTDNIDIMTRLTNQYFSDVLSRLYTDIEQIDEEDGEEEQEEVAAEIEKTGQLIEEIWKAVPEMLVSIIGQIEQNLEIEDDRIRFMSTKTLGSIIGYPASRVNFLRDHYSTFKAWIGRVKDKNVPIRIEWISATKDILENRVDGIKEIVEALSIRCNDPEERVRQQFCKTVASLRVETIVKKLDLNFLKYLCKRLRDSKQSVRVEAFHAIGNLYHEAFSRLDNGEPEYIELFGWIPTELIDLLYINNQELNELVDKVFYEKILPYQVDDTARIRRLLLTLRSLSPHIYKGFMSISKRQVQLAAHLSTLIKCYKENRASERPELTATVNNIFKLLNSQYSQGDRVVEHLRALLDSNNKHDLKLLTTCIDPDSDYQSVQTSVSDLIKRVKPQWISSIKMILYRCSYLNLNRSNITSIVKISKDGGDILHEISNSTLKEIAAIQPSLMKSQVADLATIIESAHTRDEGYTDTLKAASLLFKKFPDHVTWTPALVKSLRDACLKGTNREAKQAVRILETSEKREMHFKKLLEFILENIQKRNGVLTSTHLSTLAELCLHIPELMEENSEKITSYILKEILLTNHVKAVDVDPEWVEEEELEEECWRKIFSIRFLVNRIAALSNYSNVEELAVPVFKVLISLVGNGGEIVNAKKGLTPDRFKTRLRLEGGKRLLKLAQIPTLEKMIRPTDLGRLVLLAQDSCFESRKRFLEKLIKCLTKNLLPSRYLALMFFLAYEPDLELRDTSTTWLRARFARQQASEMKSTIIEQAICRLLSLLAHHPGIFDPDEPDSLREGLTNASGYILYYLSIVANEQNLSLIFYLAQRVKQYQDATDDDVEEISNKLYIMSDLAQLCIAKLQELKSWSMVTWPGRISLPGDAFKPMPDSEVAKKVARTVYIPEELRDELEEKLRKSLQKLISTSNNLKSHKHETTKKVGKIKKSAPQELDANTTSHRKRNSGNGSDSITTKKTKKRKSEEMDENKEPLPRRSSGRTRKVNVSYKDTLSEADSEEDDQEDSEISDY
jgi:sister chromatid cohesion protein PDS5